MMFFIRDENWQIVRNSVYQTLKVAVIAAISEDNLDLASRIMADLSDIQYREKPENKE